MPKKKRGDSRERLDKVPVTAYLTEAQARALDEIVALTHAPKSALLREGVDLVLAKYASDLTLKRFIEHRRAALKR